MVRIVQHRKRLKGLEEFETPPFVGRMERVRRLRVCLWRLMLAVAVAIGVLVGLLTAVLAMPPALLRASF